MYEAYALRPLDCIQSPRARARASYGPPCVPSARQTRPRRAPFRWSHPLGLDGPCKLLRPSALPITMHNVRHMEWGFYSVKPAIGGGGGSTWIYDGDGDASAPSDFFSPTGPPSRLPYTCSLAYRAHGSVCTRCAAGCNRRVSVGRRVVRATRLAGPCWA